MAADSRVTLASLVDDFARHGDQIAIVVQHGVRRRRVTYRQLARMTRVFAGELAARGISKGERVLIWGDNGAEWVAAFFGCVLRGVLPVPIDFASATDFAKRVEAEVAPRLAVGDASKLRVLQTPSLPFEAFEGLTAAACLAAR